MINPAPGFWPIFGPRRAPGASGRAPVRKIVQVAPNISPGDQFYVPFVDILCFLGTDRKNKNKDMIHLRPAGAAFVRPSGEISSTPGQHRSPTGPNRTRTYPNLTKTKKLRLRPDISAAGSLQVCPRPGKQRKVPECSP